MCRCVDGYATVCVSLADAAAQTSNRLEFLMFSFEAFRIGLNIAEQLDHEF